MWRIKRRVLEHWTKITNQFRKMLKNVRLTREKPCILENFRILQLFYYLCSQFSWFLKNDLIFVFSVSMRFFWTVTRLYLKKNIFLTLLQGIPNLEVRIFEKYKSQKKNKKQFWNALAEGYKMPSELDFSKKVPQPSVHCLVYLVGCPLFGIPSGVSTVWYT